MYRTCAERIARRTIGLAAVGVVVLLTAGCASSYRVVTDVLDDGTTTYTLANNEIKVEGATKYYGFEEGRSSVEKRCVLDVRAREKEGGERTFELLLTYTGVTALNIAPGRSLEVVADLNSYVLSAGSPAKKERDPSGQYFTESLDYAVSADVLVAMAEAQTLRVIVKGRDGDARGSFDEKGYADFRRFVDEYVRPR
jgi:hypothetical protein